MFPLRNHVASILPMFANPHLQLVASAVVAGNSPGLVWVDDADQPCSTALWDKTHALYLAGAADNAAFNDALRHFMRETISQAVDVLKIYPASSDWHSVIEALYPYVALHRPRASFTASLRSNFLTGATACLKVSASVRSTTSLQL